MNDERFAHIKAVLLMIFWNMFFCLFLGLKLTGNIDWSYWFVCSPLIVMFLNIISLLKDFQTEER